MVSLGKYELLERITLDTGPTLCLWRRGEEQYQREQVDDEGAVDWVQV